MAQEQGKLKLLYLVRIFHEETDPLHGLTMNELLQRLSDRGITAERKALYRDLEALKSFGLDIKRYPGRPVSYGLASRTFTQAELMLLVDAVQSSRFLTQSKSAKLVDSLKQLGSHHQTEGLNSHIHVEGRIKMQNESVFSAVDIIHDAIRTNRKIQFHYFRYDSAKRRKIQHNGEPYVLTPVSLVYSDGYYYAICYSERHDDFSNYRVDRMTGLFISDEKAVHNERIATFDPSRYEGQSFGMFGGEITYATLKVEEEIMGAIIDRFGRDVKSSNLGNGYARVHVPVIESGPLFGWLAQFGSKITVEQPTSLITHYTEWLDGIRTLYRESPDRPSDASSAPEPRAQSEES